jgi:hypothetical protein
MPRLDRNFLNPPLQNLRVGTSLAQLGAVYGLGSVCSFTVENLGPASAPLNAFEVHVKFHPQDQQFQTLVSGTNWTQSGPIVAASSGNLASLGSNSAGFAVLNIHGAFQLVFYGSTASTNGSSLNINPTFTDT